MPNNSDRRLLSLRLEAARPASSSLPMTLAAAVVAVADRKLSQAAADALARHHVALMTRGASCEEIAASVRAYQADLDLWKSAALLSIIVEVAIAALRVEVGELRARVEAVEALTAICADAHEPASSPPTLH